MANRVIPCPRCRYPLLCVPGVTAGVCPGCRREFTLGPGSAQPGADGSAWPPCKGADYIGDTWQFRNRTWTFFAAVTWHDLTYDCESTELFLIDDAGEEVSLEFEEDEAGDVVWWLHEDATDDIVRQDDGSVRYQGKVYRPHGAAALGYEAVTQAGAMDAPYDREELKSVRWYSDWSGDLGQRKPRLGYTKELGQDTWFWMTPAAAPARRTSMQYEQARRQAWARRNNLTIIGTVLALVAALVLHVGSSVSALNKLSYDSGPLTAPAQRHWVSEPFTLERRSANVKVEVAVRNLANWFDTTLCLANLDTQRRYCIMVEVDRDSPSRTGGFHDVAYFSAVPGGRYVLEGQAETDVTALVEFGVKLTRDAPRRANFWAAMAVLFGVPAVILLAQLARRQLASQSPQEVMQVVFVLLFIAFAIWIDWIS